eukprot:TRINITY_DN2936_c0_g1_i3.p1 TRINITY_DN2936_c0_g1~~TRINITY_DN2936_c0_g1_i3.p1  ORF type:complete len:293 (-),score=68.84 TRINITY_DN2936_c0_g1_i3:491-1369(-)
MLEKLAEDPYSVFGLILTPTRELAMQIGDQIRAFGAPIGIRASVFVGGDNVFEQTRAAEKRPHILIGTPGRISLLMQTPTSLKFRNVKFLVLDEADRLLGDTFTSQLQTILEELPPSEDRQTLLFSATMTTSIRKLQIMSLRDPSIFEITPKFDPVEKLRQEYMFMPQHVKHNHLVYLLRRHQGELTIVFTSSVIQTEILKKLLEQMHLQCYVLHAMMSQADRSHSLNMFRVQRRKILLATNVASRGLDIPEVGMVINYDVPRNPKDYVHRVGRTARAGKEGIAVTLVSQYE